VNSVPTASVLRFAFTVAFGMIAFGALAASPAPWARPTAANLESVVDRPMERWTEEHKGPGAVVVVVTREATVFAKGYGFADIDAKKPFTADATLVRPGSISKLFTGIAVMQLVDAGKLDLDRDVNAYIDFSIPTPEGGVPVTLRRLLTHRAGFEEHVKGLFSRNPKPEPLGHWLAKNLPRRLFPNGDVEAYSNYGVALAGYVVERVSGETYASYIQKHILDPLGMRHSTFEQPLPDDLAPLMAKGYYTSDKPPLGFFETIVAPAGGLSTTGVDMGRFLRALINGGELDGVRILPTARLDEMMAPGNPTPAGYLGLAFFGTKVAGHNAVGHDGATMTFFSELRVFPEQGIGIFVSRDGFGEIHTLKGLTAIPNPVTTVVRRFLPMVPETADARTDTFPGNASLAGVYHLSRREESSFARVGDLAAQSLFKIDDTGNVRSFAAIWPFGNGRLLKRVEPNLYVDPAGVRYAFVNDADSESYFTVPALRLQRVPWYLDVRWIALASAVSMVVVLKTLLAWPVVALWRRWGKRQWSQNSRDRRKYLAVRLVLLVDTIVIVAAAALFIVRSDLTIFNDALDPLIVGFYALAWLGSFGALLTLWAAISFWRNGVGSRWSRVDHSLIAASSLMIAWFFVTFGIAGTTLIY